MVNEARDEGTAQLEEGGVSAVLEKVNTDERIRKEFDEEMARQLQAKEHAKALHRWRKFGRHGLSAPEPQTMGREADEAPQLCQGGCGFVVRRGKDRSGRNYRSCCRGCHENPGQHDEHCRKDTGKLAVHDPELAATLQLAMDLQVKEAEKYQDRSIQARITNAMCYVSDPVWGEVEFRPLNADHGKTSRWWRIVTASFYRECPSCMITCHCCTSQLKKEYTSSDLKRGWWMLLVTWSFSLAVVQTVIFVYSIIKYGTVPFAQNKMIGPPVAALNTLGAKNAALMLSRDEWWRLFTPMLLHSGWLHLVSNLLLQLRIGIMLEAIWGHVSWIVIYLVTGVFATLCSCIFMKDSLSVGSSGALCGLLGAWAPFILATWNQTLPRDIGQRNTQFFMVVSTIVLMIPLSFLPLVDFAAHIGGTVMGIALGTVLFANRIQNLRRAIVVGVCGAIVVVVLFAVVVYVLLKHTHPTDKLLKI